jgi:hypothetical protein
MPISIPLLILIAIAGLIVSGFFVVGLAKKWGILLPYMGMILFSAMALPVDWQDRLRPTFWLPIQQKRSILFLACGVAGILVVLMQLTRLRGKAKSLSIWLLVAAGMYGSMLRFVHDSPADGAFSMVFTIITLLPLALTASLVIDEIEDIVLILRSIAIVFGVWTFMVMVQVAVNPTFVIYGNEYRFVGLVSNPQHASVFLSFCCVVLLWLLFNDIKKLKIFYIGLLGICGIFLLWTGSRTGIGMTVIGVCAILYTRAGRAILFMPIVALITYMGIKVVVNVIGIDVGVDRLVSTTDTRSAAWWVLIETGLEYPLFGIGTEDNTRSENSWLYGFAAYGIGMVGILILFTLVAFVESINSIRARFSIAPEHRIYVDLSLGIVAMYFAGALLEGYMISRVSSTLCFYPVAAAAGAVIRKGLKHPGYYDEYEELDYEYTESYSSYNDDEDQDY